MTRGGSRWDREVEVRSAWAVEMLEYATCSSLYSPSPIEHLLLSPATTLPLSSRPKRRDLLFYRVSRERANAGICNLIIPLRSFLLCLPQLDAELLALLIKMATFQTQRLRRVRNMSAIALQLFENGFPFEAGYAV